MSDPLDVDEQIDRLADWIDIAADALMRFYVDGAGLFLHRSSEDKTSLSDLAQASKANGERRVPATSTLRSFFGLAEYLRFLYEEGRVAEPREGRESQAEFPLRLRPRTTPLGAPREGGAEPDDVRVRRVLLEVIDRYLGQLAEHPRYVRESSANGQNMFTDGQLLTVVSALQSLQKAGGLDGDSIAKIVTAASRVVDENLVLLDRWQGGKLRDDPGEQVHHFVTLHAVRGIDAYHYWTNRQLDHGLVARLRERVRGDVLDLLAYHAAGVSSRFDASELAFGLALLARFPTPDDTGRLVLRAIEAIAGSQAADGAWPPARYVSFLGYRGEQGTLHVTSYEVALTLAQLLSRCLYEGQEADQAACQALLPPLARAFELVKSYYGTHDGYAGWANDHTRLPSSLESWTTAIVLTFLIHYRDALLEMRQRQILARHDTLYPSEPFWIRTWPDLTPLLRSQAPVQPQWIDQVNDPTDDEHLVPALRAHTVEPVERSWIRRPRKSWCLLYGPPGTGKTRCANHIAAALGWPCLSISPPCFLRKAGLEGFEASAVEIFDDLQRLRRVVVLFDECEDFFRRREPEQQVASRTIGA
ncbi:MAG: AAA family ATPase, partial [Anaerolineae bacterium]|nr:AAA family ATPase [Anaerolineae bacterium]